MDKVLSLLKKNTLTATAVNLLPAKELKEWMVFPSSVKFSDANENYEWITFLLNDYQLPNFGWKIHISSALENASIVLEKTLPVLIEEKVGFKFAGSLEFLTALNAGHSYDCQAGKFITIYPSSDHQAVKIAYRLHRLLENHRGPRILSDRPLSEKSLVHYRWGSYVSQYMQTLYGEIVPVIRLNNNKIVIDQRIPFYVAPAEIKNPFTNDTNSSEKINRLIKNRYVIVQLISRSLNGDVMLALDRVERRRCILKSAARDSLIDELGRDVTDRLQEEKFLLMQLNDIVAVPKVYDSFYDENGNFILVMEDIAGESLENIIINNQCISHITTQEEILNIACQLSSILKKIHFCKIVHADIKPSNIIISSDGTLRLIDFNTSYRMDSEKPRFGGGTRGYCSPQLMQGMTPTIADDIYSFGAVLYYYATNGVPAKTGYIEKIDLSLLKDINPALNKELGDMITKLLNFDPNSRWITFEEIEDHLNQIRVRELSYRNISAVKCNIDRTDCRARAYTLTNYLIDNYYDKAKPGAGFAVQLDNDIVIHDYRGSAGCILALASLIEVLSCEDFKRPLEEASFSLIANSNLSYNKIPGLYVGESGVALALLKAGKALNNSYIINEAVYRFEKNLQLPHESPDLYNGSAGRLKVALQFWQYTKNSNHFNAAKKIAKGLVHKASVTANGEYEWIIPDNSSLPYQTTYKSATKQLGYAHGVAGISDALLDYYSFVKDEKIETVIKGVIKLLKNNAKEISAYQGKNEIHWPISSHEGGTAPFWCHGAAGIGKFFLSVAKHNLDTDVLKIVELAANSAANAKWCSPIQCHGLAGNIQFLLEVYEYTQKRVYLDKVKELLTILNKWIDRLDKFPWGISGLEARDYMCGIPGLIDCYLHIYYTLSK